MPSLAHVGHWWESVLIAAPTLGFVVWLGFTMLRERRRAASEGGAAADEPR